MIKIELKRIEFKAYHGIYQEEKINGNTFFVDITVKLPSETTINSDAIFETIDYEVLAKIAAKRMEKPTNLIETVATSIADDILAHFPALKSVKISVSKANPPIGYSCQEAKVTIQKGE
jgi:dihydroneopterin aldolase